MFYCVFYVCFFLLMNNKNCNNNEYDFALAISMSNENQNKRVDVEMNEFTILDDKHDQM